ncbi:MAG: TetR/AcrR family transcriptional regulator, partial [Pseudomonadota bacterium]
MTTTPKRGRKFDQVLDGALKVFMEHGFEGASVDEIARVAGVSKATLYSYFPDKAQLFSAVAQDRFQNKADHVLTDFDFADPPDVILPLAGHLLLSTTLSD